MNNIYNSPYYKDNIEAQEIKKVLEYFKGTLEEELEKLRKNQYLLTADEVGIAQAEQDFEIIPDLENEDLEERRKRVILRNSTKPPYTFRYLKSRLDEIFGAGNYEFKRDIAARSIIVETAVENAFLFIEISLMINKLKPANMIYLNSPFLVHEIGVSEEIWTARLVYNYRLGTTWILGQSPFFSEANEEIVKMANEQSITAEYLNKIAISSINEVVAVKLNNSVMISSLQKIAEGNIGLISYTVQNIQASEITKIELLGETNKILASANIYVPVGEQVKIKHKILIREAK